MKKNFLAFCQRNRMALSALTFFIVMMLIFIIIRPGLFLRSDIYLAIAVSLPVFVVLAIPLVFIVVSGEIDLSFPAVTGLTAWVFAAALRGGLPGPVAFLCALVVGVACGCLNAFLVTRVGLSALVSTLGMNFLLRGLINIGNQGHGMELTDYVEGPFGRLMCGPIDWLWGIPAQMLWAIGFTILGWMLFNRHKFGAHIKCIGDNKDSSREMGINVRRVKTWAFIYMGVAAAIAGTWSDLINWTFYPTTGDGYLLYVIAAVFVGGTPTWGGVGTIVGAFIGACIIGTIETGVIACGLTGFYTQFFYGLIIVLSLVAHRFNKGKSRY